MIGLLLVPGLLPCGVAVECRRCFHCINPAEFQYRDTLEMALTRHVVVIGTIAANAPYTGLLSTVLGIMLPFQGSAVYRGKSGGGKRRSAVPVV